MKPDWKDAPEWANYLAMDENGIWVWHEAKPHVPDDDDDDDTGGYEWISTGCWKTAPNKDTFWKESLEERPK